MNLEMPVNNNNNNALFMSLFHGAVSWEWLRVRILAHPVVLVLHGKRQGAMKAEETKTHQNDRDKHSSYVATFWADAQKLGSTSKP